jgi:hypothetical protein
MRLAAGDSQLAFGDWQFASGFRLLTSVICFPTSFPIFFQNIDYLQN